MISTHLRGSRLAERETVSDLNRRDGRDLPTTLRPCMLIVSHPSGRRPEHAPASLRWRGATRPNKSASESENTSAGQLARSLSPCRNLFGSKLFYFLDDYFYLLRIARSRQAGKQASRQTGWPAGRPGAAVAPHHITLRYTSSAGSGPS